MTDPDCGATQGGSESRLEKALVCAVRAHVDQFRKGTCVPYISHLLHVAAIVYEYGGDEDQAIGALLHDSVEDAQEGTTAENLSRLKQGFGEDVEAIVKGCTDTPADYKAGDQKPPWRERKEAYIEHVRTESNMVRLVSAADKLANARSILKDVREHGNSVFSRFNGGKAGTFWYYRALIDAFRQTCTCPQLVDELNRTISEAERLAYPQSE